jgi:hypothetical protein
MMLCYDDVIVAVDVDVVYCCVVNVTCCYYTDAAY